MNTRRPAFTLVELLLAIAIIAILAGIVIVAINPIKQLQKAEDAKRGATEQTVRSALTHYSIDNGLYPSIIPNGVDNAVNICSPSVTSSNCIDLSPYIQNYMATIPADSKEVDSDLTGLRVYQENGHLYVYSIYKNKTLGSLAADDMVAYYRFDETSTGTALDSSGNGYDAVPVPSTGIDAVSRVPDVQFLSNKSRRFDNADDYLSISAGPAPNSAISICSWVYSRSWDNSDDEDIIVRSNITNSTGNFVFEFGADSCDGGTHRTLRFGVGNDADSVVYPCSGSTIELNNWHHVCGTYDGTTARIYVDGTEAASASEPGGITSASETVYIGGRPSAVDYFDGYMDDIRIYDRALNADEISELASGL